MWYPVCACACVCVVPAEWQSSNDTDTPSNAATEHDYVTVTMRLQVRVYECIGRWNCVMLSDVKLYNLTWAGLGRRSVKITLRRHTCQHYQLHYKSYSDYHDTLTHYANIFPTFCWQMFRGFLYFTYLITAAETVVQGQSSGVVILVWDEDPSPRTCKRELCGYKLLFYLGV